MLRNYIKASIRFFTKNKAFALLSFLGLLFGFVFSIALVAYINFELSYDSFHPEKQKIFRVHVGEGAIAPKTFPALASELRTQCGECTMVRMKSTTGSIGREHDPFKEQKIYWADNSFLGVFGYPLLSGNPETALAKSNTALLTRRLADRLFRSNEDPRGETIIFSDLYNQETTFEVTGVLEDVPENSHLTFDALFSYATLPESLPDYQYGWSWRGIYTYVKINRMSDKSALEPYYTDIVEKYKGVPYQSINPKETLSLIPITDLHLNTDLPADAESYGSIEIIYSLVVFAVLLFIISLFNYINLTTVSAVFRFKEIGVKKIIGANTFQIIYQFLVESFLLFVIAFGLAAIVFATLHPYLNSLVTIENPIALLTDSRILIIILSAILCGAAISTFYTARLLTKVSPVNIVRNIGMSVKTSNPSRVLMTAQFMVTLFLLISTHTVYHQITYMTTKKLGINIDQVLVIKPPRNLEEAQASSSQFKNSVQEHMSVYALTSTSQVPGKRFNTTLWGIGCEDKQYVADENAEYNLVEADENFVKTFGLNIVHGRNFNAGEKSKLLINGTAAKLLGIHDSKESIGQRINFGGESYEVVGVVNDYHHLSVKEDLAPILILQNESASQHYAIKLNATDIQDALSNIKNAWATAYPNNVFDYFFLDAAFNQAYKDDVQFGKTIGTISILILVISYFGLAGTIIFLAQKRAKEISIRRVLGGGSTSIFGLFFKDNGGQIIIASFIAIPLSYYMLKKWIERYPFNIDLSADLFIYPVVVVTVISSVIIALIIHHVSFKRGIVDTLK